jgi:hypothetical protein
MEVSEHFLEFTYNAKLLVERRATPCGQQQRFRMKTITACGASLVREQKMWCDPQG